MVRDGIHRGQFADTGEYFGNDGPKSNAQRLFVNGAPVQRRQGKEQGITKIIEEIGQVEDKGLHRRQSVEGIQPRAEQRHGCTGHRTGEQPRETVEPQQEEQEYRGAETHPEVGKITCKGMYFRLPGQGHQNYHKEQNEVVEAAWFAVFHRGAPFVEKIY